MYSISNLTIRFSGVDLFTSISFLINEKDRVGLTGKNGAGKSTLLKLLSQQLEPSEGQIICPSQKTVGYLPQHIHVVSKLSVFDETITAFEEHHALEAKIADITKELENREDYESNSYAKLINSLQDANDKYAIMDGQSIEGNTEKVLLGLGFDRKEFTKSVSELSGGWKMRIELAKILLKLPDLILLDEPTNHLDIESIQWLEDFLKSYNGAVVLVSHDRAFLDAITNRTVEITKGRIYDYKCNYSNYVIQREELLIQQKNRFENQQKEIKEIEDFIERFRYKASKSKQVQSRVKMLEKIDRQGLDLIDKQSIHFTFPTAPSSGKISVEIKGYGKTYGTKNILNNLDLTILRNEFIAFVGRNGEGKSTLAKSILGQIDYDGEIKIGHNVKVGYYAQNQAELLDENDTVFEVIDNVAVGEIRKRVKGILGSFLFSGDDLEKKVKVLSGGERSRLALAKLLLEPVNLLVLDEPTNHLDMQSKDILKQALLKFDGTLILVSHDRDFLKGLSNKVYEFRNQSIKEHLGDITEFIEKRKLADLRDLEVKKKELKEKPVITNNKLDYLQRKEFDKKIRKAKKQISQCEENMEKLENQIAEKDKMLSNPELSEGLISDDSFYKDYNDLKAQLGKEEELWEESHMELEELQESAE